MMDKHIAKMYKLNKRQRSLSEDDTLIMNTMQKQNHQNNQNSNKLN